ncbi:MAG TPA: cytochrome c3 family protein [Chitinophagaceae bacterium]|nr:cytochrome c3 family protein [Chitinophagaceae bacterium]
MLIIGTISSFLAGHKKLFVTVVILLCIIILSNCISGASQADLRGELYAGSHTCRKCHRQVYDSYVQTAHFNTSGDSLPVSVLTAFGAGKNVFRFNDSTEVVMEHVDGRYYQSYYRSGRKLLSHPFDIVIGSGRKAQTYLYYNDKKKISQLPISYFMAEHAWANSPGFPPAEAKFDRNIPSYCLACHSSYVSVNQTYKGVVMQEEFEKGKIIYGIDCERCHGPAFAHVEYFTNRPNERQAKFITSIRGLNRVQKNDLCALCHSGFRDVQQSLFKFKPGDDLNNFYIPDFGRLDTANMDVHGNQTQLMMASKCFQQSNELTCTSCHNVHTRERDDMAIFSQRCMNCHQQVAHSFTGKSEVLENAIQTNCIDCHMPLKASSAITMLTNQQTSAIPDYIRTHLIATYERESKQFLDSLLKRRQ